MNSFYLRCVQLDLARQMEPVPVIKEFIEMAGDNGYNGVLLYLEDRIRTNSYPYPLDNEAYTEEEIRDMVSFAEKHNVELIPCVATLGHAERFLRHRQLNHLSETRPGMKNKFGVQASADVFCISNPEFYAFMETYLKEVASLFPSAYFHIGLDEFFDFNLCGKCRAAMPTLADEEQAFLEHIVRIRKCLAACGKRIMMWSDMLEIYTTVAARLPKDVIMVDWQYRDDVRNYMGHLLDMDIEHRPDSNEALGLETIIAPSDQHFTNASSMMHACEGKKIMGFLMTCWEKSDTYLHRSYPVICYSGRLANGEVPEDAWLHTMEYIFGTDSHMFANAMKLAQFGPLCRHFAEVDDNAFFCRPFLGIRLEQNAHCRIVLEMLRHLKKEITTALGQLVWLDTVNMLEEKAIRGDIKEKSQDIIDYGVTRQRLAQLNAVARRFEALIARKQDQWNILRQGILPNIYKAKKTDIIKRLHENIGRLRKKSWIRLRCAMFDQFVVNFVKVEIQSADGLWMTVTERSGFKADELTDALFEYTFPYECKSSPQALRITTWGMGGRGFAFAEIHDCQGRVYVPTAIKEIHGIVEHPEHFLENNGNFTWFGEQSTRQAYHNPQTAFTHHILSVSMNAVCRDKIRRKH